MSAPGIAGRVIDICGHSAPTSTRGVAGVRAMVEVGAEHGVPARTCLSGSGIGPTGLGAGSRIRAGQELVVAENLVRATGDPPGLGLAVGGRFRLRDYGVWGFALLTSPTLRDAAVVGMRYLALTCATTGIGLREQDDEAHLVVDDAGVPAPVRRFLVERELAIVRVLVEGLLGEPFQPSRLDLRFPRPESPVPYDVLLGVPSQFGAEHNALVAEVGVLDRPLPQADADTTRVCERECREVLARRGEDDWTRRVRAILGRGAHTIPDMDRAAAELNVSTRTLRRYLAVEGTTYQRLADDVRRALALDLLTTTALPVEQLAVRLGYADAAAFTRAFRRWTGTTPGAHRAART